MMKIKYKVLEKLNNLTSSEMKLAMYIAKISEEQSACVQGLYYRDAMESCGFCKQSYYNALRGLIQKGIISSKKNSDVDADVQLLSNDFPWQSNPKNTYADGYISLTYSIFNSAEFLSLKANEKYLMFEFMRRTYQQQHSYRIRVERFMQEWMDKLHVTKRILKGYLKHLKQFFSVKIKNSMYHITRIQSKFQKNSSVSEEMACFEQDIRCVCNRMHISYTPDNLRDTAGLIRQYKKIAGSVVESVSAVAQCIGNAVDGIVRKERVLDSRIIHNLLRNFLGMDKNLPKPNTQNESDNKGNKKKHKYNSPKECNAGNILSNTSENNRSRLNTNSYGDPGVPESGTFTEMSGSLLKSPGVRKNPVENKKNRFHNFHERDYDFDKLEQVLLNASPL